ncbi:sigma-70 family RNA polymerase sigma factor [Planomonospora sp. ID67723]|uniref:RNA polymerase sigma factor n=1 Tax=Planomonospora sp. ID67723 TaxID=2738134 RepID=UPI0018C40840|nr:sigma-70 family RNA polymerase sigma factor [Planomonospora sp. ID67723]MBG0832220.1 sigma-70 family RNA polymerase sigma factor [Planomonospora sp. ID67723]
MTQPLLGQRSRSELIAELYDRHAAGLFAYCHDQLGDPGTAGATLAAVLNAVSSTEPPRAALYALARRELLRRDVVYSPPSSGADPVAAFVERVLRDLRPHQREVLFLSGVCEMDTVEMSWVLDVAADTADELTVSACRRFAQSLTLALASARVPLHLQDVFGALAVAPIRDVLARAPWATPPAALRGAVLGPSAPGTAPASRSVSPSASPASSAAGSLARSLRPLWPTTATWPQPLAEPDAPTGPVGTDVFSPPDQDTVSAHEATTEPMPKLRDSVLTALDDAALQSPRPRPRRPRRPQPRVAMPLSAPIPADILESNPPRLDYPVPGELFRPLAPETRAALAYTDKLVASAPREAPGEAASGISREPEVSREIVEVIAREESGDPVGGGVRHRHRPVKPIKRGEHHYDWAWELAGFLICLAIAMIVFFAVPTIVTP